MRTGITPTRHRTRWHREMARHRVLGLSPRQHTPAPGRRDQPARSRLGSVQSRDLPLAHVGAPSGAEPSVSERAAGRSTRSLTLGLRRMTEPGVSERARSSTARHAGAPPDDRTPSVREGLGSIDPLAHARAPSGSHSPARSSHQWRKRGCGGSARRGAGHRRQNARAASGTCQGLAATARRGPGSGPQGGGDAAGSSGRRPATACA